MSRLGTKNFAAVDLGDRRRTQRLIESAALIAAHPEKPFNQVFHWNDLRGFYRLCNQRTATVRTIQEPHWQQTQKRMQAHPVILCLQDTTELDFNGRNLKETAVETFRRKVLTAAGAAARSATFAF